MINKVIMKPYNHHEVCKTLYTWSTFLNLKRKEEKNVVTKSNLIKNDKPETSESIMANDNRAKAKDASELNISNQNQSGE